MKPFGILLIIATTLFPAYLLFSLPDVKDQIALFSQYLGMSALILMAWGQILSTRLPGVETVFGGLDRVYVLHKWAGITAMLAVLLHDTIDADMRGLGPETALTDFAETLGEISLYAFLILVVISVATFIPYHLWKWTHKAMGAFFAASTFHFVFILKPFAMTDPAGLYVGAFCAAGLAAYLYMLLPETMRPSRRYEVIGVAQHNDTLAVTIKPKGRALKPKPGQFGIFRFTGAARPEPHPFTFSHIGKDGSLRVSIRALGDFTAALPGGVRTGQELRVQGPFGRFRLSAKSHEVWIAGGIGITPFLTWADALAEGAGPIDLFFCAKSRDAAPHLEEIEKLAQAKPNLTLHLVLSGAGQRLSAQMIAQTVKADLAGTKVAYCGPIALRRALQTDLKRHGVTARNFHYEEFEFRTGIGLKRLARWIMDRRQTGRETPSEARS